MDAASVARSLGGRKTGAQWMACCPAHDDQNPSLSLRDGRDGRLLVHCHSGCEQKAVIDALRAQGLWEPVPSGTSSDQKGRPASCGAEKIPKLVLPVPKGAPPEPPSHPTLGAPSLCFTYVDRAGLALLHVMRFEADRGKTFRPLTLWQVGKNLRWRWEALPPPLPLYRLPDLTADDQRRVIVVEGEKAADVGNELLVDVGVFTTWPGGANRAGDVDAEPLRGRHVVLIPDNDEAGINAMKVLADRLKGVVASIRIAEPLARFGPGGDAGDISSDADADYVREKIACATDVRQTQLAGLGLVNAADLLAKDIPPPEFVVEPYLTAGMALLAGRPKMGKSWLALNLVVSVAAGHPALGRVETRAGRSLYLALEDTEGRLQGRLRAVLQGQPAPRHLECVTSKTGWRRLDDGGLDDLRAYLTTYPDTRLVVIDTYAKVRPRRKANADIYAADYGEAAMLKSLADEFGVCIVVVTHLRKQVADDYIDTVQGSSGVTGAADTIIVLKRERGQATATLHVTGRDIPEVEHALEFDQETGLWTLLGDADEFKRSKEQTDIIRAIRENGPMAPKEISEVLGKKPGSIRFLVSKMSKDGILTKSTNGQYTVRDL